MILLVNLRGYICFSKGKLVLLTLGKAAFESEEKGQGAQAVAVQHYLTLLTLCSNLH